MPVFIRESPSKRPDRSKAERELISGTIADLNDSIGELESRIEYMQEELEARRQRLETWRRKLNLLSLENGETAERHRRPKGENLRAIIAVLQNAVNGLAASEIQRKTEMPWSSIQATLKRNTDRFVEQDGLWRLRASGASQNGAVDRGPVRISFKDAIERDERELEEILFRDDVENPDAPEPESDEEESER